MSLSAAQERQQRNAVIIAARQAIYASTILKYGRGTAIAEIAEVVTKGTTPKTYGFDFVQEGTPFLRAEEVLDGQVLYKETPFHINAETSNFMNRSRTQDGDVLVTIAGSIGRVAVVPPSAPELNMNQAVALIRCKSEINPYFLCHMLQSPQVQKQIFGSTVTTAISNLSLGKIKEIIVPLLPLTDQEAISEFLEAVQKGHRYDVLARTLPTYLQQVPRIVARIEELAAKIEEARGLRREAVEESERLIGLVVSECFEKGVENGWSVKPLGEYVISDCYGTSEKTTDDDSGTPILRMGNIQNGHIDQSDLKYLHLSDREKTKLLLSYGDILVNRTNSAELVGKCAVFDLEGEYGFASYLIKLRLDTARVEPRLVAAYINSPTGRTYMLNERKQMTGQANVNATKLKALTIALPSRSDQHHIGVNPFYRTRVIGRFPWPSYMPPQIQ